MVLNGKWNVDFAKHQTNDEARLWEIAENLWGESDAPEIPIRYCPECTKSRPMR
jgi:hypothetical protein